MVGVSVESGRIGFVRDVIVSCYSTTSGTIKQIQLKIKLRKTLARLSYKRRFKVPRTVAFKK